MYWAKRGLLFTRFLRSPIGYKKWLKGGPNSDLPFLVQEMDPYSHKARPGQYGRRNRRNTLCPLPERRQHSGRGHCEKESHAPLRLKAASDRDGKPEIQNGFGHPNYCLLKILFSVQHQFRLFPTPTDSWNSLLHLRYFRCAYFGKNLDSICHKDTYPALFSNTH